MREEVFHGASYFFAESFHPVRADGMECRGHERIRMQNRNNFSQQVMVAAYWYIQCRERKARNSASV
jgi:hypothetical protein